MRLTLEIYTTRVKTRGMLNPLEQKMLFRTNEISHKSCDTMAEKLIELFGGSEFSA